ncbi:MAG: ABC transporter permease [Bdellovibrionaceae bacterium]|nr:ABC transporter permease [Pseudobdellovibrionaceae bacterium]|tara:strand:+ start:30072 stop:30836 length:765 start_codon:yes stop_codon:yes gene_type:complete
MTLTYRFISLIGGSSLLFKETVRQIFRGKYEWNATFYQIYAVGVASFPVVMVTTMSIGMVMALQFGIGLAKFGGSLYIPKIVSLSVIKEFGPVFASIMVAARVGSGMTSEIGSMVVTEQVNAIQALGTSPIKKIVVPRVVGLFIALPVLCVAANILGVLGGFIVGVHDLGLDPMFYYQKIFETLKVSDYLSGFGKTFFFALMISVFACYYGLNVKVGTKEVGYATTKSVVTSCIAIMIGDYFLTKLFWLFEVWI